MKSFVRKGRTHRMSRRPRRKVPRAVRTRTAAGPRVAAVSIPRDLRRVFLAALQPLAEEPSVDFRDTPEEAEFRAEASAWLERALVGVPDRRGPGAKERASRWW